MINVLLVILIVMVFAFTLYSMRDSHYLLQQSILAKESDPSISLPKKEYKRENNENNQNDTYIEVKPVYPLSLNMLPENRSFIQARDHAVLSNPLYPPLNRQALHENDTYRLLGYVVNEESCEDSWHLYGRKKNNNQGEFYLKPSNRNTDLKIPLTNDIINTRYSRLRDIYTLPDNLVIEHPLFQGHQYSVIEFPQHNFDSIYF